MRRSQREHLLRAAATISGERDVLVIGSQSILAAHQDQSLPVEATGSIEADAAFFGPDGDDRADQVDGAVSCRRSTIATATTPRA